MKIGKEKEFMKKVLGSVFILGLLALPITTISAKPTNQQSLYQTIGERFGGVISKLKLVNLEKCEQVGELWKLELEEYEKILFPGLKDDEFMVRINEGGFLYDGNPNPQITKESFEALNGDVEGEIVTVKEAKEICKRELVQSYNEMLNKKKQQ